MKKFPFDSAVPCAPAINAQIKHVKEPSGTYPLKRSHQGQNIFGFKTLKSTGFQRRLGVANRFFSGNYFSFFAVGGSSPFKRR